MIQQAFKYFFLERPASKKDVSQWITSFAESGEAIQKKTLSAADSESNRKVLSHIIGIERWGNRRLEVALGEPFIQDEYNNYRPPRDASWEQLQTDFADTRNETTQLLQKIKESNIELSKMISHNQYGDISLKGWMRYLVMHANLESKRLR